MNRKLLILACVLAIPALAFTACGRGRGGNRPPDDTGQFTPPVVTTIIPLPEVGAGDPFYALIRVDERFPATVVNDNPIMDGGILRWAIGTSATLPGIFCAVHFISALDGDIRGLQAGSMFSFRMDWIVSNLNTLVYTEFCRENQTITMTMQHEAFWHDGVQVTMDDLYFANWVIAHPDY